MDSRAIVELNQPKVAAASASLMPMLRERLGQFVLVVLFLVFASSQWMDFQRTGRVTGLVYLVLLLLIVVMTITRRSARQIAMAWPARVAAVVGTYCPLLFRPGAEPLAPGWLTASISAAGLAVAILGIVSLRRSFGVVAAHRGVVDSGVYRVIRHPLYSGYMLNHLGFFLATPSPWNFVVWMLSDTAQLFRIHFEEQLLSADPQYAHYLTRVRWRLFPGIV